jgi:hypothetical protein
LNKPYIIDSYSTLSLVQVYGAITYYLEHRQEIDEYLKEGEAELEKIRQTARQTRPLLYKKLDEARQVIHR